MVSSDTVVGIVGAVILTGAMIAVFYYENTNADDAGDAIGTGTNLYVFEYRQANVTVEDATAGQALGPGQSKEHTFDLPPYAFMVHAMITWTETGQQQELVASGPDQFRLELLNETDQAPPGENTATGRGGELEVHHGHGPDEVAPEQSTVRARGDSPEEAQAALLNETAQNQHGVGEWTVKVTLVDVGDQPTAAQVDTGNTYTITIMYSYWEPVLLE